MGKRIETLRLARGLSKADLAIKAGIHPSALTLLERDARPNARVSTLQKVADALGVPVSYLMDDQETAVDEDDDILALKAYREAIELARSLHISPEELVKLIKATASVFQK